jgi:hypothetical protein
MPSYYATRSVPARSRQYEAGDPVTLSTLTEDERARFTASGAIVPARFVDTAANLAKQNPVVGAGLVAYATDTGEIKIGDGVNAYSSLVGLSSTYAGRLSQREMYPVRSLAFPSIMASPPTIGASVPGSPSSSIASAKAWTANSNPGNAGATLLNTFNYLGTTMTVVSAYYFVTPSFPTSVSPNYCVEFDYYGTKFEYGYQGVGNLCTRVWVDGQPAETPYTSDATQDGAIHLRPVTFGSAGWRRIRIDLAVPFWGVNTGPTDTVVPTPVPTERLLVIGDSYGNGTGSSAGFNCYAHTMGQMLGYTAIKSLSVGSTGLLAGATYRSRAADWSAVGATAAAIQLSVNDNGSSTAAIAAELALLVPIVKALPTVKDVWVLGTAAKGGGDVASRLAREPALAAAAAAAGVPYVSLISPYALWSGTGYAGATTGVGNSDIMMYSDNAHPSQAGHDMIAKVYAAGIYASRAAF